MEMNNKVENKIIDFLVKYEKYWNDTALGMNDKHSKEICLAKAIVTESIRSEIDMYISLEKYRNEDKKMIINIEKAKEYEITPKDLAVYYCLIQNDGKLSNKELRSILGSSYGISEIAGICSKLEDKRLIKRYLTKTNKVQYEILYMEK